MLWLDCNDVMTNDNFNDIDGINVHAVAYDDRVHEDYRHAYKKAESYVETLDGGVADVVDQINLYNTKTFKIETGHTDLADFDTEAYYINSVKVSRDSDKALKLTISLREVKK